MEDMIGLLPLLMGRQAHTNGAVEKSLNMGGGGSGMMRLKDLKVAAMDLDATFVDLTGLGSVKRRAANPGRMTGLLLIR